jgi:hypothetical protein
MRARDIIICLTALIIGTTLLITAGNQLDYINLQRKQMNLVRNEPLENAPPSLAFATVAMGAFRGLIVDILWIRADRLKEEGQFFDARQLAEWIVTLQPRFSRVWAFQAWNMAYNLSVAIPASEADQRWRWVRNGYELLRDRGIPLNPTDISLYRELALIFQHKMGGVTDDAHRYYKLQLAQAMTPLLGPADEQYFEKLVAAPKTLEQILADAEVAKFVADLKAADETFADDSKLVANYLALRQEPKLKPDAFRVIDSYRRTGALEKFDIFAKAYQLRNVWKLEPQLMQEINKTYGPVDFADPNHHLPMDWRHPDTHAIYWAIKGLETAHGNKLSMKEANTDRIVSHSLANLYNYGTIFIYDIPAGEQIDDGTRPDRRPHLTQAIYLRPDLRMFDSYNKTQLAIIEKYKSQGGGIDETYQTAHKNFLKNAVLIFYLAGHEQTSRKIYEELQKLYPDDDTKVELIAYLRNRLREKVQQLGITDARNMIYDMLRNAYFYYAMRDDDEAYRREKIAAEVHKQYTAMFKDEQFRVGLPSLSRMKYLSLIDFLNDSRYPGSLRQSLRARIQLERPALAEQLDNEEKKYLEEQQNQQQTNQP